MPPSVNTPSTSLRISSIREQAAAKDIERGRAEGGRGKAEGC
jgi:hypothetical protein